MSVKLAKVLKHCYNQIDWTHINRRVSVDTVNTIVLQGIIKYFIDGVNWFEIEQARP